MIPIENPNRSYHEIVTIIGDDFEEYMERLFNVLKKFQEAVFIDPKRNLYKAVLMKRTDYDRQEKVRQIVNDTIVQYIIRERIQCVLKYKFKPMET